MIDDLSTSLLGPYLTGTTRHMGTDAELCVALLRIGLKRDEREFMTRVCAIVEHTSSTYERDHLGTGTDEHLTIFEGWVEQRRWLERQIVEAADQIEMAAVGAWIENMTARTTALSARATDERMSVVGTGRRTPVVAEPLLPTSSKNPLKR